METVLFASCRTSLFYAGENVPKVYLTKMRFFHLVESNPVVGECSQAYHSTHATKVRFEDARMEKLSKIPLSSAKFVQVLDIELLSFKMKGKEDWEFYTVFTQERQGTEKLTLALGEVRPDTYVQLHLIELNRMVNNAQNIIDEDNVINEPKKTMESFARATTRIFAPLKIKEFYGKSLSHQHL